MANTKITNPELFNLGDSTSATQLPVMTTTQRIAMNAPPTFNVDYLVVAGGASGANQHGGGGGAGGLRTSYGSTSGGGANAELTLSLTTGTSYSLTVGDGGAGVTWVGANLAGNNGYDSVFNNITSIGGGGGSSYATQTIPSSGGSGGGGGSQAVGAQTGASGEPGQGYAGGSGFTGGTPYPGGGGGGAGGLGGNATTGVGGNGGDGLQNDITVTTTGTGPYYAGGGGSATYGSGTPGTGGSGIGGAGKYTNSNGNPGNPQTGSGGGGTNGGFPSGSGGSGIVVLRYPTADVASYTATGLTPTETTVGTDTVLSFTTVGTGTVTFTSPTPTGTISTGEMIFNSTTDKVEYWDGTKWYGITYEAPAPVPVGGTWDPTNSITSPCYTGSGALNFSNNNRLATETGAGYYVAAYSTVKVGDFWFFGADAGGNTTQFEGNFDAADQVYTPTDPGTYIEIKYLSPDLSVGITKTRICPYSATWYSNTIRWFTWSSSIVRYNDTPFTTAPAIAINDIIGILVDVDTDTVKFYKNNVFVTTQDL